jgi:hypothetical protein
MSSMGAGRHGWLVVPVSRLPAVSGSLRKFVVCDGTSYPGIAEQSDSLGGLNSSVGGGFDHARFRLSTGAGRRGGAPRPFSRRSSRWWTAEKSCPRWAAGEPISAWRPTISVPNSGPGHGR